MSIVKKSLCWLSESVVVEASIEVDADVPAVVFTQSGFRLSCDISHDTELNFEIEKVLSVCSSVCPFHDTELNFEIEKATSVCLGLNRTTGWPDVRPIVRPFWPSGKTRRTCLKSPAKRVISSHFPAYILGHFTVNLYRIIKLRT